MDGSDDPPDDYQVGYGKPPVATRFKKGQSGNPSGRPKRRDSTSAMLKVIDQPVVMRSGGRQSKAPLMEVLVRQMRDRALKGDQKAARELREMIESFDDPPEPEPELAPKEAEARLKRIMIAVDHEEIRDALLGLRLMQLNEDGRTKLCPEFFIRLFGPDYIDSTDPVIQELISRHMIGTCSI